MFYYIALYNVFKAYAPDTAVLFLILSILVSSVCAAIFLFVIRNRAPADLFPPTGYYPPNGYNPYQTYTPNAQYQQYPPQNPQYQQPPCQNNGYQTYTPQQGSYQTYIPQQQNRYDSRDGLSGDDIGAVFLSGKIW